MDFTDKKTLLYVAVALIIGFIAGAITGPKLFRLTGPVNQALAPAPQMPKYIGGTIKSVEGNTLRIDALVADTDKTQEKTVTLTDATVYVMLESKDQATFQKELLKYQDELKKQLEGKSGKNAPVPTPPLPTTEKKISLTDLKAGLHVGIETKDEVRNGDKIEAVRVTVMESNMPNTATTNAPTPPMPK